VIAPLPARPSLSDDVYEAIKTLIMNHAIAPGSRLSIDQLARDLAVSPTPIREALARLESDGLAVKESLRGYSTTPVLTSEEVLELFELRGVLEPWLAERAATRRTPEDLSRLHNELASMPAVPSGQGYEDYRELASHDSRFHLLVAGLAGNAWARAALERTHCHLHLFRLNYTHKLGSTAIIGHREIVAAIEAGDPGAARSAMQRHLDDSRSRVAGE
jgi:DNA-binding GntR family transcriptional regulator